MNKKNPLVSIIVPVYKVESYLDACVSSVAGQTCQNLEIILVDDGSPDGCPAKCDTWADRDNRIHVIHKENGGLSDARNAGLKYAHGDLYLFVDSDDIIRRDFAERLIRTLLETDADIVECNYTCFHDNFDTTPSESGAAYAVYSTQEALRLLLAESSFKYTACNKLYRRGIFDDLCFEKGKLHEDNFFTWQAFAKSTRIVKIEESLYGYRQRTESIMGGTFSLNNLDAVEARKLQYSYMKEQFPSLAPKAQSIVLGTCLYLGQKALREADASDAAETLQRIISDYIEVFDDAPVTDTPKQIWWYKMARKDLERCCRLRNRLGIGV